MTNAIEVHDLTKRYGDVEAVRDISLTVAPGEVFCLLGPNGAGKTTTAEIVEGRRRPSAGRVSVLGRDPGRGERTLRDRIGIVLQDTALPDELTVGEVLEMTARWYSRSRTPSELIGDGRRRDCRVGPPEALGGRDELPTEIRFGLPAGVAIADLPELPGAAVSAERDDAVLVTTADGLAVTHALTGWALERGIALHRLTRRPAHPRRRLPRPHDEAAR